VPIQWLPDPVNWRSYVLAWQAQDFTRYFFNSGVVAVAITLGNLLLCSLAGYSLAKFRYFGRGLLFILIFSVKLDWLPMVYSTDITGTGIVWLGEQIRQAIMPVMVLGLFQAASMTRFVRSAVLDVIRLDYVTTARAKGLGQTNVIVKHVLRNAMIPVVTLIALQIPAVFGGAIVTEQIFRIPGIGSLLISSILSNDTPVVMAVTFVFACLVVLFNLIADVLYGWLDPRISLR
jgi:peptide/nickel transport system permease protein